MSRPGPLKIAYFGLPLGALLLQHDGHQLDPVVLSPIAAPGRWRLRRMSARAAVFEPEASLGQENVAFEAQVERAMAKAGAELLVSWFWTRRLPERFLKAPTRGALGVHPSLLPRHRGPSPYFWAIDAGDLVTGVSLHRLEAEYDTGDVLAKRELVIGERDAWQLARALDRPSLSLLRETLRQLSTGAALTPTPQNEAEATWAGDPEGDALRVDFTWPTERVLRRIRALSPTPGLALELFGVRLFVTRARATSSFVAALLPGEAELGERLKLRTSDGAIEVLQAFLPHDPDGNESAESSEELGQSLNGEELASFLDAVGSGAGRILPT